MLPASLDKVVITENKFSGLTIAVLVLGESGSVQLSQNEADNCHAGIWFLSPLQAGLILYEPQNLTLIGLSVALGYPLPHGDSTAAQMVTVPPAPASVRLYTGKSRYSDSMGSAWIPDVSAKNVAIKGGRLFQPVNPAPKISGAQPAGADEALYQSERYGTFSYTFSKLPTGFYSVTLKFAEIRHTDPSNNLGARVFDVAINNQQVLNNFDIVADAGGSDSADDWPFNNIVPDASGQIVVQFTGTSIGSDSNAKISALEVDPQWSGAFQQNPKLNSSEFLQFYVQLEQLGQQGFVKSQGPPTQLRVTGNEMQGLSSAGVLVLGDDEVQNPKVSSLMMTGNRLTAKVPFLRDSRFGNVLGGSSIDRWYFSSVATIHLVTRCVVSGNMISNEEPLDASRKEIRRLSLVLDDGAIRSPAQTAPPPEILVASNLFQGRIPIEPARFPPDSTVPFPMNSWDFLNTVIP